MWEDPIVKEIHAQRKKIAEDYGYDVKAIIDHYREKQKASGCKVVTRPTRRSAEAAKKSRSLTP